MNRVFRYLFFQIRSPKTIALVGKSGTGKSYRSKVVADRWHCQMIIDDGLLIKGDRILAGRSAKRADTMLGAVRTAVFDDPAHRREVVEALKKQKYRRILIVSTSDKMAFTICARLGLPQPEKILRIEDIATQEEIEAALRARNTEGKHVIPVPSIEVTRKYPQIVYDTLRVFSRKARMTHPSGPTSYEKTIVRPEFSPHGIKRISDIALKQMVAQILSEWDPQVKVTSVKSDIRPEGYVISVFLSIPRDHQIEGTLGDLQAHLTDSLETAGSIFIASLSVEIDETR